MPAAQRRAVGVGTLALIVALAVPAMALAKGGPKCNASACKVYSDGAPSASGQQGPPPGSSSGGTKSEASLPVSKRTSRMLAHVGKKDRKLLRHIISDPAYGAGQGLAKNGTASIAAPSALGAAFDLGAGPAVLLAFLLGTVAVLGVQGGLRSRRRRSET